MPASESTIFSPIPFQGFGLVSPDPFPHERVGSGHKTISTLSGGGDNLPQDPVPLELFF